MNIGTRKSSLSNLTVTKMSTQRLSSTSVVQYKKIVNDDGHIDFVDGHFDLSNRLSSHDLSTENNSRNDSQLSKYEETPDEVEHKNEVRKNSTLRDNNGNDQLSGILLHPTNTSNNDFDNPSDTSIKLKGNMIRIFCCCCC